MQRDPRAYLWDAREAAMANQLIHGYATVNPGTVWNIVQNALPGLLGPVQTLLDEPSR